MYGIETQNKAIALASALSYWVFRCRDKAKNPAMGLKTWEYFQRAKRTANNQKTTVRGLSCTV